MLTPFKQISGIFFLIPYHITINLEEGNAGLAYWYYDVFSVPGTFACLYSAFSEHALQKMVLHFQHHTPILGKVKKKGDGESK